LLAAAEAVAVAVLEALEAVIQVVQRMLMGLILLQVVVRIPEALEV
jgi:hypothetical protein